MKKEKKNQLSNPAEITYSKSNKLINKGGNASLLAKQLFAVGLVYLQEEDNKLFSVVHGSEIVRLLGTSSHNIYNKIKLATYQGEKNSLMDWKIINEDDENHSFSVYNVVKKATYSNGELQIFYNEDLRDLLTNLKDNYTRYNIEETLRLKKSKYSFTLFELLKSHLDFTQAIYKNNNDVSWKIGLTDLKLRLGMIDYYDDDKLSNMLMRANVNFEKVEKYLIETGNMPYAEYKVFKSKVLNTAIKEINEMTCLDVEFSEKRKSNKVAIIVFNINYKENKNIVADQINEEIITNEPEESEISEKEVLEQNRDQEAPILSNTEKLTNFAKIAILLGNDLEVGDIQAVANAANYNVEAITNAYNIAKQQGGIRNLTAWLIAAVQSVVPYSMPKNVEKPTDTYVNSNGELRMNKHGFEERVYDYGELEKKLRKN